MNLEERIASLSRLGEYIGDKPASLQAVVRQSCVNNPWFTEDSVNVALDSIRDRFLRQEHLNEWVRNDFSGEVDEPQNVGLVLAGNIPLVGFHDLLCTLISGHRAIVKCSSMDPYLIPHLLDQLIGINKGFKDTFEIVDTLKNFDAVIATGSDNTAKHFERYFSGVPNIIRRNRNGIAVLSGREEDDTLEGYAEDVFRYFGLGCRNVSKVYLPEQFDIKQLINAFEPWHEVIRNEKYKNNFDFNLSTALINGEPHIANDFIVLLPKRPIISRIGTLHYELYSDPEDLKGKIQNRMEEVQCISTELEGWDERCVKPGRTQKPALDDYADGVNTIEFLQSL